VDKEKTVNLKMICVKAKIFKNHNKTASLNIARLRKETKFLQLIT